MSVWFSDRLRPGREWMAGCYEAIACCQPAGQSVSGRGTMVGTCLVDGWLGPSRVLSCGSRAEADSQAGLWVVCQLAAYISDRTASMVVWFGCGMDVHTAVQPSIHGSRLQPVGAARGGIRSEAVGRVGGLAGRVWIRANSHSDWLTSRDVLHARAPRRAACRLHAMLPLPGPAGPLCTASSSFSRLSVCRCCGRQTNRAFLCIFRWRAPRRDPAGWR